MYKKDTLSYIIAFIYVIKINKNEKIICNASMYSINCHFKIKLCNRCILIIKDLKFLSTPKCFHFILLEIDQNLVQGYYNTIIGSSKNNHFLENQILVYHMLYRALVLILKKI